MQTLEPFDRVEAPRARSRLGHAKVMINQFVESIRIASGTDDVKDICSWGASSTMVPCYQAVFE